MLLVRKRGTHAFMQPGGKIEHGEEPAHALCRELAEELGLAVEHTHPRLLGEFRAPAANEPGHVVLATLYFLRINVDPLPGSEIAETAWIDPDESGAVLLAPLTRDHVLPLCRAAATARSS